MEPFGENTLKGWQDTIRNALDLVFYVTAAEHDRISLNRAVQV